MSFEFLAGPASPRRAGRIAVCIAGVLSLAMATGASAQYFPSQAPPPPPPSGIGGFFGGLLGKPEPAPQLPSSPAPWSRPPVAGMPGSPTKPGEAGDKPRSAGSTLGGGYRTVCVRLCDGYYWPVTHNASRSRFSHDARACQASCSSEARLFIMPASGDAKDMTDLAGRSYAKLATAFRHRKGPVSDCRCRPPAWDQAELERHARYAAKAAGAGSEAQAAAEKQTERLVHISAADADRINLAGAIVDGASAKPLVVAEAVGVETVGSTAATIAAPSSPAREAAAPDTATSKPRNKPPSQAAGLTTASQPRRRPDLVYRPGEAYPAANRASYPQPAAPRGAVYGGGPYPYPMPPGYPRRAY
jgi:hypothetical protein